MGGTNGVFATAEQKKKGGHFFATRKLGVNLAAARGSPAIDTWPTTTQPAKKMERLALAAACTHKKSLKSPR